MREYFLTYRHTNGHIIGPKHITELDLGEIQNSPFVADMVLTPIDFHNYQQSKSQHKEEVKDSLL